MRSDAAGPSTPLPAAYVPVFDGRWGNPVLWTAKWFGELRGLRGDRGARTLLERLGRHATVGVVSGRRLEDVRRRCGVHGIIVAGLHGLEIDGHGPRPHRLDGAGQVLRARDPLHASTPERFQGGVLW